MGAGMRRNSSIFQSTLPQGERLFGIYSRQRYCFISIHAPARGATTLGTPSDINVEFQSTLPQGERHGIPVSPFNSTDFNPRSRKGSDTSIPASSSEVSISIHAPARGATYNALQYQLYLHISIHAPARGATSNGRE